MGWFGWVKRGGGGVRGRGMGMLGGGRGKGGLCLVCSRILKSRWWCRLVGGLLFARR